MASVRKRTYKDGSTAWVVDFRDDRGNRVLKTFEHKKSADAFRNNIVIEVQAGRFLPKSMAMSWTEAVEGWLEVCRKRATMGDRMTRGTVIAYEHAVARLEPFFGKLKVGDLTLAHVQEMVDALVLRLSAQSVRHSVRAAFSVCGYAVEIGRLKVNPVAQKKLRLPGLSRKPTIPPKDALRAILAAVTGARGRYEQAHAVPTREAVITLALFGGLRRGEICGLRWMDVDLARGVIHIRRSMSYTDGIKGPKTKAGYRDIPMATPIADALRKLHKSRNGEMVGPEDRIVLSRRMRPMCPTSIYGDHWRPTLIKAGLIGKDDPSPYRFHSLRHAALSLLIDQGLSPLHVKGVAGHASITTTLDVYGHLFPTDHAVAHASKGVVSDLRATETQLDPVTH